MLRTLRADIGPVVACIATILGALAGVATRPGPALEACVASCAIGALLGVCGRRGAMVAGAALCCFGLAYLSAARAHDGVVHHALAPAVRGVSTVVLRGSLVTDPDPGRFATTVLLRADHFRDGDEYDDRAPWQPLHRVVLLHATRYAASEIGALEAGDTLQLEGVAKELHGFDAREVWRHAVARVDVTRVLATGRTRSRYLALADALRGVVERGLAPLPVTDRALLDGFILGDTRAVDVATVADFRASGLSHLLAVSGANVAFVLALVRPLQRRLPTAGRYVSGIAVVAVFAAMTRFEPSVLRASAMALIVMTARASGRSVHALRSLSFAVILLLLVDPFLAHSVGFQLSASACAGIALLARPVERRLPGPEWMRTVLAITIAAQAGVAPVLVAVFGSVAWIAPAANLLAVPAAEPITVLAIPIAVIGAVTPPVAAVGFVPVVLLVRWTREVAHVSARAPVIVAVAAAVVVAGGAVFVGQQRRNSAVGSAQ